MTLIDELGLETFPTYTAGKNIFERGRSHGRYSGTIPSEANPVGLVEVGVAMRRLNAMAATVPPEAPWATAEGPALGLRDLRDLDAAQRPHGRGTRHPAAGDHRRLGGRAARTSRCSTCSSTSAPPARSSCSPTRRAAPSRTGSWAGRSWSRSGWRRSSGRRRCELATPVRAIDHGGDGVTVGSDRLMVAARQAIVAVPPALAGRIAYEPALPAVRDGLTQRMAQGSVVKCMAVYERPFWRDRGFSGAVTSVTGPVSVGFDNSPPDGTPGVLLGFLEGRAAREAADLEPDERRRSSSPAALRGCSAREARSPIDYVDRAWAADEWSRGCYGGFMPPGAWTDYGAALAAADRPDPLGGRRNGDRLERVHGRRGFLRAARGGRGARGARMIRPAPFGERLNGHKLGRDLTPRACLVRHNGGPSRRQWKSPQRAIAPEKELTNR